MTDFEPIEILLTFNDILLVPQLSDINSRDEVDLRTGGKLNLKVPLISANMDTVTEEDMALAMASSGGAGIIHRYLAPERLDQIIVRCRAGGIEPIVSIGFDDPLLDVAIKRKVKFICIDVAHGHHTRMAIEIFKVRERLPESTIIAGNVATGDGALYLAEAGADIVKVGVGSGSICSTRLMTGHGIPQLAAIREVREALKDKVEIIADGGIRHYGDIAKALAVGADYVMSGYLFAGCPETPGARLGIYRGMASREAQSRVGKNSKCPEGVSRKVSSKPPVAQIMKEIEGALQSALSYSGARTLDEFRRKALFSIVSPNVTVENGTI